MNGSVGRARLLAALLAALLAQETAATAEEATRWLDRAPRTADGRFTNPVGSLGHGSLGVRLPFFGRRVAATFRLRPGAAMASRAERAEATRPRAPGESRATWIGHATVLVEMEGVCFLTDPTWSDTASPIAFLGPPRLVPPGLAIEALPEIDFVVVSHNHYDHLDLRSLVRLSKRSEKTRFFVPLGNGDLLQGAGIANVEELDWTETRRVGPVTIHSLPTQHWSKRSLRDDDRALWSAWAVIGPNKRFFFAGDTGYHTGFREIGRAHGPFDLAAVPIGAYRPRAMMRESHMNPEEAWRAASDLRARRALGVHFGTFDLADEPSDEPAPRFKRAARRGGREQDAWVLGIGGGRRF